MYTLSEFSIVSPVKIGKTIVPFSDLPSGSGNETRRTAVHSFVYISKVFKLKPAWYPVHREHTP